MCTFSSELKSQAAGCRLQAASYRLQATGCKLQAASWVCTLGRRRIADGCFINYVLHDY